MGGWQYWDTGKGKVSELATWKGQSGCSRVTHSPRVLSRRAYGGTGRDMPSVSTETLRPISVGTNQSGSQPCPQPSIQRAKGGQSNSAVGRACACK